MCGDGEHCCALLLAQEQMRGEMQHIQQCGLDWCQQAQYLEDQMDQIASAVQPAEHQLIGSSVHSSQDVAAVVEASAVPGLSLREQQQVQQIMQLPQAEQQKQTDSLEAAALTGSSEGAAVVGAGKQLSQVAQGRQQVSHQTQRKLLVSNKQQ